MNCLCQPPSRGPPKIFQLRVKTHKLTIFLTLPNITSLSTVKSDVLSALSAFVAKDVTDIPALYPPDSTDAFELAREVKTRQSRGVMMGTGTYERLEDESVKLIDIVSNWDALYIMFRDEDGMCPFTMISLTIIQWVALDGYSSRHTARRPSVHPLFR